MGKRPRRMKLCECGCGGRVKLGNKFIHGHNARAMSAETKEKMSASRKGKSRSEELKAKMRVVMIGKNKGKKISDEQKKSISLANKGKVLTSETKRKISEAKIGFKHTEEAKKKMSDNNWIKGKTHSEKSKRKMSKNSWSRKNSGPKHPGWRGGASLGSYTKTFYTDEFRNIIDERDGDNCQNPLCRHNSDHHPIEFHHINYIKKDCDPQNIIKVCKSCNSRANHNREFWQKHYEGLMEKEV